MTNFKFIAKNLDISNILQQVLDNPQDWKAVSNYENIGGDLDPPGFLPLVMAYVQNENDDPKDTELLRDTPLRSKYIEVLNFLKSYGIKNTARAAFFKLKPGGSVNSHIDIGKYYLTKDRYHLSLQGKYRYTVDGETHIIEPGTFFWFDNKKFHDAVNIGDEDRITFVFDVPHSPKNPHHLV